MTLSSCCMSHVWRLSMHERSLSAERPWNVEESAEVFKNRNNSFTLLSRDCQFSDRHLYWFVHWCVTLVSVTRSREVSAIRRSLCTVNYRDWFGTAAIYPHCGSFRNTRSQLLEVSLYSETCDDPLPNSWIFKLPAYMYVHGVHVGLHIITTLKIFIHNYACINVHCTWIIMNIITITVLMNMVTEATRYSLGFQNFPWGRERGHAMVSPLWQKILYKNLYIMLLCS